MNRRYRAGLARAWSLGALGVLLSLALAACASHGVAPARPAVPGSVFELSDASISAAVERELEAEPAVSDGAVLVSTREGVVRLDGSVRNLLARRQAQRRAASVRGVRAVVNQIEVRPERTRADALLVEDVREALRDDAVTADEQIDVAVRDGAAVLSGTVDSHGERELAELVAASVDGLIGIRNELEVVRLEGRSDEEIEREIEARLRWDALANAKLVRVEVEDGRVMLLGTVGSAAEKERIARDAWVRGVRSVASDAVDIDGWARPPDTRAELPEPTDHELREAVSAALFHDPRTSALGIDVQAYDGIVILRGEVGSLSAKQAAEQDAEATVGTHEVRNALVVRATFQNSEETEQRLKRAMSRHPYLAEEQVAIQVEDGVAALSGIVTSSFERAVAEQVAARAQGVERVENAIEVEEPRVLANYDPYGFGLYEFPRPPLVQPLGRVGYRSDQEIASNIRRELLWSPLVDANEIDVSVRAAVAILEGRVGSRAEMLAAINNAFQGGAHSVDNRLRTAVE